MGTEAFWIPAAMAAVSAIGQGVNQQNATKRSNNAEVQALTNQNQFKNQANSLVNQQTRNIATSDPNALKNQEESAMVNTLRQNVGGSTGTASKSPTNFGAPTSALGPTPSGSSRYNADKAAAGTQVQNYGNTIAGQESALDSAIRQRQNEGLQMQTLGANLNNLNAQSMAQGFVDQLRARAVGTPNPWVTMFTQGLGGAASGMSKNGWFTGGGGSNPLLGNGSIGGGMPGDASLIPAPSWGANLTIPQG